MDGMDGMNGNYRKVVDDCEHLADQATYEFKKARIIDRNVTVSVSHPTTVWRSDKTPTKFWPRRAVQTCLYMCLHLSLRLA